jgi:hypothetical protein
LSLLAAGAAAWTAGTTNAAPIGSVKVAIEKKCPLNKKAPMEK